VNVAAGKYRIAWLHLRRETGELKRNPFVIVLIRFTSSRREERPVTLIRHVEVKLPNNVDDVPNGRRLRASVSDAIAPYNKVTPMSFDRDNPYELNTIRKGMFKNCRPSAKYAMFAGLQVSGHIWRLGSCDDKNGWDCPEGEIAAGYRQILKPSSSHVACLKSGMMWCSGELYSCSHAKAESKYRPLVNLKLSKSMESLPSIPQLDFWRKRIALALSLLPEDIELTNISALMDKAPEMIFQVIGNSDMEITPELLKSVITSGLLSFTDSNVLVPSAGGESDSQEERRAEVRDGVVETGGSVDDGFRIADYTITPKMKVIPSTLPLAVTGRLELLEARLLGLESQEGGSGPGGLESKDGMYKMAFIVQAAGFLVLAMCYLGSKWPNRKNNQYKGVPGNVAPWPPAAPASGREIRGVEMNNFGPPVQMPPHPSLSRQGTGLSGAGSFRNLPAASGGPPRTREPPAPWGSNYPVPKPTAASPGAAPHAEGETSLETQARLMSQRSPSPQPTKKQPKKSRREELGLDALKKSALRKRAMEAGANEKELEQADDADDPKDEFIKIILARE